MARNMYTLTELIHFNEKSKISFIDQQLYDGIKVFDAHVNGLLDASAMLSYRKSMLSCRCYRIGKAFFSAF